MKKINYLLLALIALFVTVSCDKKPPVEDGHIFKLKISYNGQNVEVKDGDSFVFDEPVSTENPNELGFHGVLTTEKQFKLVVDFQRECKEGTRDELCIGECKLGQKTEYDPNTGDVIGYEDIPQLTFDVRALEVEAYSHCTPQLPGDNIITYTFYDNQEPEKKLTFKVNYKLPVR